MSKLIIAKSNRGAPDPIGLHDTNGTPINPATNEKLDELKSLIDTVEEKLQSLIDKNQALETGGNLDQINTKLGETQEIPAQYSVLDRLKRIYDILHDLFSNGNSKVKIWDSQFTTKVSPLGELYVRPPSKVLITDSFAGTSLNLNKWDVVLSGNGTYSLQNSGIQLKTTTASGDKASILSSQTINNIFGVYYSFQASVKLLHTNIVGNTQEWGMCSANLLNALCFRLKDGILEAVAILNGNETSVNINSYKPLDLKCHLYKIVYKIDKVLFYIDDTLVATIKDGTSISKDDLVIHLLNENTSNILEEVTLEINGVSLFDDSSSVTMIAGEDDNHIIRRVAVNSSRRLLVSQEPPSPPPETTAVARIEYGNVSGSDDNEWVIPNGKTLTIQRLSAGAEPAGGSNVELWYDPDGTKTNMQIIDVIFSDGQSDQHDLNATYIGDGVAQIVMRRTGIGSSNARLIFGRWEGYYV